MPTVSRRKRSAVRRAPRSARDAPSPRRRRRLPWWPGRRARQRLARTWRRAPGPLRVALLLAALAGLALAVNWIYQVARKPTELFFPVSGTLYKTAAESWHEYGPLYRRFSTALVSAPLLAALAQVEGSGNPIVRTYWRWSWHGPPLAMYRPASSAVGMYQMTDGTFAEAQHYCIREHRVIQEGAWDDLHACWFNRLYFRVLPSHAVELTAAYLDRHIAAALAQAHGRAPEAHELQQLAAVIHLCGAGAGEAFARRGFRLSPGQRCGDHDAREYVSRVERMREVFSRLAARESP